MSAEIQDRDSLVGRAFLELAHLPEEDVPLVIEFMSALRQRWAGSARAERGRVTAELVARARQQAAALQDVPREQLAARFVALTEDIRARVISQGTAIDGDWRGD